MLGGDGPTEVEVLLETESDGPGATAPAAMNASPDCFDLTIPGVARYRVERGEAVAIAPVDGADSDAVRLFLLGSALGALLHQRGVLPLHGAAVRTDKGYLVIVGTSGSGKSSLSAALGQRGWAVASDDISAVRIIDGQACVAPGYPERKVWPDVLAMLGDDADQYPRVRAGLEKRRVPIDKFSGDTAPLVAVIGLVASAVDEPIFTPINGGLQMMVLKHHTYRPSLSVPLGAHRDHFATITTIASQSRMWQLERPRAGITPAALADALESHLGGEGISR